MRSICFYFQVHQPYRVSQYSVFEVGSHKGYFEGPCDVSNFSVFEKVAKKCYLPANRLFLELLKQYPELRISFSITGVFLEQCQEFGEIGKEVLESFQALAKTGQVEFLGETYYHSLAALYSEKDFKYQVRKHTRLIKKLFNTSPRVFRNTELIYENNIARLAAELGFKGVLVEGWDHVLGNRSPNFVYKPAYLEKNKKFGLLLKNYRLADDIAFRFSDKNWSEHPLTVEKFVHWVLGNNGDVINLFMDYETFGEHQWEDTGIFEFLRHLPLRCREEGIGFLTPSEALQNLSPVDELDVPYYLSWADMERDLSAWLGNDLQKSAMKRVFDLEEKVLKTGKKKFLDIWHKLQTSDHFYYMSTKYWSDGDVHKYFSPFQSPYDAFMNYVNILTDFEKKLEQATS